MPRSKSRKIPGKDDDGITCPKCHKKYVFGTCPYCFALNRGSKERSGINIENVEQMSTVRNRCRSCGHKFSSDGSLTEAQTSCPACHSYNAEVYVPGPYYCPRCGSDAVTDFYHKEVPNQPAGFMAAHWGNNPAAPLFGIPIMANRTRRATFCKKCGEEAHVRK
jgi:hypothetical protein